jgi:hypothetical protein
LTGDVRLTLTSLEAPNRHISLPQLIGAVRHPLNV